MHVGIEGVIFSFSFAGTYRSLWETYYDAVDGIIFVIDSTDRIRMCVARDELEAMLRHPHIAKKKIPILFFANKMDIPAAMEPSDIMPYMGLEHITDKPWQIQASNALTGDGVDGGIAWLADHLARLQAANKEAGGALGGSASSGPSAGAGAGKS